MSPTLRHIVARQVLSGQRRARRRFMIDDTDTGEPVYSAPTDAAAAALVEEFAEAYRVCRGPRSAGGDRRPGSPCPPGSGLSDSGNERQRCPAPQRRLPAQAF